MGATSILACKICPAGFYCPKSGLVNPVPCPDGFVCPPGTKSLGQANVPCPIGHFCRGGSKKRKCPAGSYQVKCSKNRRWVWVTLLKITKYQYTVYGIFQDEKAQAYCKNCPVGFWCQKGSFEPVPCGLGTFSNKQNITRDSECEWCRAGMYCNELGLNKPTGQCPRIRVSDHRTIRNKPDHNYNYSNTSVFVSVN